MSAVDMLRLIALGIKFVGLNYANMRVLTWCGNNVSPTRTMSISDMVRLGIALLFGDAVAINCEIKRTARMHVEYGCQCSQLGRFGLRAYIRTH